MSAAALVELNAAEDALCRLRALLTGAIEAAPAPPLDPPPPGPAPAAPAAAVTPPAAGLQDPAAFFAAVRAADDVFAGRLTQDQVDGCLAILKFAAGRLPASWAAYDLATAYHETGHTMQPVRERGNGDGADADRFDDYLQRYDTGRLAEALGNTPEADGDGVFYAGRGLAQITGARNYRHANDRLHALGILAPGEDLTKTPDLALRLDVAVACLVIGSLEGWYTGKRLNDYIPAKPALANFVAARRIINGTDRAELIAKVAVAFLAALVAGGWR